MDTNKLNNGSIGITARSQDWDGTFQLISWWKKDVIRNATVLVVGAGALGNEVLKNLALLNVGNIVIADFDTIEYSNLSRSVLFRESDVGRKKCDVAAERIQEINPNVKVKTIDGDITVNMGTGIFRRMDAVIGCLDNRLARLFLNRNCFKVNKTWIDAAIENLAGQVYVFKPGYACYECNLSRKDWKNIQFRLGCADVAKRNFAQGRIPTTPISSSIMAAIQVQEALKVINGDDKLLMKDQHLYYEGRNNIIMQLDNPPLKEICQSHFEMNLISPSPLSCENTVKEALEWLSDFYQDADPMISLDNDLILQITTKQSEVTSEMIMAKPLFTEVLQQPYRKIENEDIIISKETKNLDKSFPFPNLTLKECGIPYLHIMQVWADGGERFVELTADESYLNFA